MDKKLFVQIPPTEHHFKRWIIFILIQMFVATEAAAK